MLSKQLLEDINQVVNSQIVEYEFLSEETKRRLVADEVKKALKKVYKNVKIPAIALSIALIAAGCKNSPDSPPSYHELPDRPKPIRGDFFRFSSGKEMIPAWIKSPEKARSSRFPYVASGESNSAKSSDRFNRKRAIYQARLELLAQLTKKYSNSKNVSEADIADKIDKTIRQSSVIATYEVAGSKQVYVLVGVDSRLVDSLDKYDNEFPDALSTQRVKRLSLLKRPPATAQKESKNKNSKADDFFNTED